MSTLHARKQRELSWQAVLACGLAACAHHVPTDPGATSATAAAPAGSVSRATPRFTSPYSYEWFIRAEILAARGDLKAAIAAYRAALASAEEDPYVLARLADALDESGRRDAAETTLDEAAELDPRSEAVWWARAVIAERHGEIDRAMAAYERAEACAPVSARAPVALAQLLKAQGSVERAIAVLERYEARTLPGSAGAASAALDLALLRNEASAAYVAAQTLARSAPNARVQLVRTARELADAGRATLAARVLDAIEPRSDEAPLRLRVLIAAGRHAHAEAMLFGMDPAAIGGLAATAEAFLAVRRADLALDLANAALATAPEDSRALLVHANASLELQRYVPAAEGFAKLTREPSHAQAARAGLARVLRANAMDDLASRIEPAGE